MIRLLAFDVSSFFPLIGRGSRWGTVPPKATTGATLLEEVIERVLICRVEYLDGKTWLDDESG